MVGRPHLEVAHRGAGRTGAGKHAAPLLAGVWGESPFRNAVHPLFVWYAWWKISGVEEAPRRTWLVAFTPDASSIL